MKRSNEYQKPCDEVDIVDSNTERSLPILGSFETSKTVMLQKTTEQNLNQ